MQPVIEEYKAGEIIVLRGQVITPAQLEALQQFGLIKEPSPWQNYAGAGALVLMLAALSIYIFREGDLQFLLEARSLVVIALIFIVFYCERTSDHSRTARCCPMHFHWLPVGLLIATLVWTGGGIVFSIVIVLSCALQPAQRTGPDSLLSCFVIDRCAGAWDARRVWTFFRAGMAMALARALHMLLAFRVPFTSNGCSGAYSAGGAAIFSGLAACEHCLVAAVFPRPKPWAHHRLATDRNLTARFSAYCNFFTQCPRTYQHSLQVANLAEQAAEADRRGCTAHTRRRALP